MSYVTVGNPGNAPDPATGSLYGEVDYSYNIGEYDVTDSQYATFLNDVDPTGFNVLGLYSGLVAPGYGISFDGNATDGSFYSVKSGYANMPVVGVTFWDAVRFVNWVNNGEGNAGTETGAYTLMGGTPTPSNSGTVARNADATVWLPNQNEWYKAGYYDPSEENYSAFATKSDGTPGNTIGNGANEANYYYYNGSQYVYSVTQSSSYDSNQNYLTPVGSFTGSSSFYGTYDQSGDVSDWSDTIYGEGNRSLVGGSWNEESIFQSTIGDAFSILEPYEVSDKVGFRVVEAIPEPSSITLMFAGVGGLALLRRNARRPRHSSGSECSGNNSRVSYKAAGGT